MGMPSPSWMMSERLSACMKERLALLSMTIHVLRLHPACVRED
jgi:hypothetical protein